MIDYVNEGLKITAAKQNEIIAACNGVEIPDNNFTKTDKGSVYNSGSAKMQCNPGFTLPQVGDCVLQRSFQCEISEDGYQYNVDYPENHWFMRGADYSLLSSIFGLNIAIYSDSQSKKMKDSWFADIKLKGWIDLGWNVTSSDSSSLQVTISQWKLSSDLSAEESPELSDMCTIFSDTGDESQLKSAAASILSKSEDEIVKMMCKKKAELKDSKVYNFPMSIAGGDGGDGGGDLLGDANLTNVLCSIVWHDLSNGIGSRFSLTDFKQDNDDSRYYDGSHTLCCSTGFLDDAEREVYYNTLYSATDPGALDGLALLCRAHNRNELKDYAKFLVNDHISVDFSDVSSVLSNVTKANVLDYQHLAVMPFLLPGGDEQRSYYGRDGEKGNSISLKKLGDTCNSWAYQLYQWNNFDTLYLTLQGLPAATSSESDPTISAGTVVLELADNLRLLTRVAGELDSPASLNYSKLKLKIDNVARQDLMTNLSNDVNHQGSDLSGIGQRLSNLESLLSGGWWRSGGDKGSCYGKDIGNSDKKLVIDLDDKAFHTDAGTGYDVIMGFGGGVHTNYDNTSWAPLAGAWQNADGFQIMNLNDRKLNYSDGYTPAIYWYDDLLLKDKDGSDFINVSQRQLVFKENLIKPFLEESNGSVKMYSSPDTLGLALNFNGYYGNGNYLLSTWYSPNGMMIRDLSVGAQMAFDDSAGGVQVNGTISEWNTKIGELSIDLGENNYIKTDSYGDLSVRTATFDYRIKVGPSIRIGVDETTIYGNEFAEDYVKVKSLQTGYGGIEVEECLTANVNGVTIAQDVNIQNNLSADTVQANSGMKIVNGNLQIGNTTLTEQQLIQLLALLPS